MQKKCSACGSPFPLSGSGKRQKLCLECQKRGIGQGWGLSPTNPLISKGAKSGFRKDLAACVMAQIEAVARDDSNPISFITPDGTGGRVWLASDADGNKIIGDDRWWRVNVVKQKKRPAVSPWKPTAAALNRPIIVVGHNDAIKNMGDALGVLKGFRIRLCIDVDKELQVLGCGWRIVTAQLRGNVLLHHNGNTATMSREAFKELLSANKRVRRKRPRLRLAVSNPPLMRVREAA